ncbi:MAG: TonB family protein [Bryobacteraceae bacterium]
MTWMELLWQCCWRGTIILLAAFAANGVMRKAPAAWRHFLWTAVMAGLLVLPAMVQVMPKWGLQTASGVILPGEVAVAQPGVMSVTAVAVRPPRNLTLLLWLAGCALTFGWFLVGRLRAWMLLRRAGDAPYAQDAMADLCGGNSRVVHVHESARVSMPLTWGIWRATVVLPVEAREWSEARLRTVLLHELIHVERRDLLAQTIGQAACCLYWFHPLAWLAARQLKVERERACDDAVVSRGVPAADYAGHLTDLARALASNRGWTAGAVTMAEVGSLESRVRALLDRRRNRRPLTWRAMTAIAAACLVVLTCSAVTTAYAQPAQASAIEAAQAVPDAAAQAPAETLSEPAPAPKPRRAAKPAAEPVRQPAADAPQATGSLSGAVNDPSGAFVPNARVTAKNVDGSSQETAVSDFTGNYRFNALLPGEYAVEVTVPGFKTMRVQVTVAGGQAMVANAHLTLGDLSETISVKAARPTSAAPAAKTTTPTRIQVGGNVQAAMILKRVTPVYPADLKANGVTGTVMIEALIKKDGTVSDLHVMNTDVDPGLVTAATDAVSQWQYRPALLNGQPVTVLTNIAVSFELSQ